MLSEYRKNLDHTMAWIKKSRRPSGGSAAYYSLLTSWSKAYPETTGYLIPTLIDYAELTGEPQWRDLAGDFGKWLLSVQMNNGAWTAGLHPTRDSRPSVFNTAQILLGITRLYREYEESRWAESADRAVRWLVSKTDDTGLWLSGHYNGFNPTYYTRAVWPLLDAAILFQNSAARDQALKALDSLADRLQPDGTFDLWGFKKGEPAFTHTIAYTIRGLIECSFILNDWERYGRKTEQALERFYHIAERNRGRLDGSYGPGWRGQKHYTCLTGNLQISLCLMRLYDYEKDLRLLNAASKLIEYVIRYQKRRIALPELKGSLAGSSPLWGNYMAFRYPNWAAKFYADALMKFIRTSEVTP